MAKRPLRQINRTRLIVVEGDTEEVFLHHLKNCYYQRGILLSVSIKNAHGHGPDGVIDKIRSVEKTASHDEIVAVLDDDIQRTAQHLKAFHKLRAECIVSSPAIESTLLNILGKKRPDTTARCKTALAACTDGESTDVRFYEKYFSLEVLNEARPRVSVLNRLIEVVSEVELPKAKV